MRRESLAGGVVCLQPAWKIEVLQPVPSPLPQSVTSHPSTARASPNRSTLATPMPLEAPLAHPICRYSCYLGCNYRDWSRTTTPVPPSLLSLCSSTVHGHSIHTTISLPALNSHHPFIALAIFNHLGGMTAQASAAASYERPSLLRPTFSGD